LLQNELRFEYLVEYSKHSEDEAETKGATEYTLIDRLSDGSHHTEFIGGKAG